MLSHLQLKPGLQHVPHQIGQQATLTGQRDTSFTADVSAARCRREQEGTPGGARGSSRPKFG